MRTVPYLKANDAKHQRHFHARPTKFSLRSRFKSFVFAGSGIVRFFKTEHNAWLHLGAATIVGLLCIYFPVSRSELVMLVFSIAFVWVTEMINTAIEKAMDFVSMEKHPEIKAVKDIAAGAVLLAAIAALIAGFAIFIPKIF